MHLRLSTIRRENKTYRYAQLVESYRRLDDGRPAHRVLANLGALDDEQVSNLRAALEANRCGESLMVSPREATTSSKPIIHANYRYLDLAVLLRIWEDSGVGRLLSDLASRGLEEVPAERVIAALVLHRCVAAGSKLAAGRWFPETALPELLGVAPGQFNNSRLHRVLEVLDREESNLQARLPHVIHHAQGACVRLFIDATDTWFVGRGPKLAEKGLDKEGVYRRRVGIVLLCDQRGFPLRWQTLAGSYHDETALLELAKLTAGLDWVRGQPVVMDRAVGNAHGIQALLESGLHFVTALPWVEFESSGAPIPWEKVSSLQSAALSPKATDASVAGLGEALGFSVIRADRLILDLGEFEREALPATEEEAATVVAMRFAKEAEAASCSGYALAARHGISETSVRRHRCLLGLLDELQRRTLAGEARSIELRTLHRIAELPEAEQTTAFEAAIGECPQRFVPTRATAPGRVALPRIRLRGVAYFNHERCRATRKSEEKRVSAMRTAVAAYNDRLARTLRHIPDGNAVAAANKMIQKAKMGNVYTARVVKTGATRTIDLIRDEAAWNARRKVDGLFIVVTHPELRATPEEVTKLYFEKDVIEKDFQTIKSVVEIRPVHHQTDVKLRAHVTLCMLALLLRRVLAERLKASTQGLSAARALETLATAHLNLILAGKHPAYSITQLNPAQQSLLAALSMEYLARDDRIASTITPR